MGDGTRLDKWLWGARWFKTRALAKAAIEAGQVQLNGTRVKPSRNLKCGDRLTIRRADQVYEIDVADLAERRVGAALAGERYVETAASVEHRRRQRELKDSSPVPRSRRPTKRERRLIHKFKQDQQD